MSKYSQLPEELQRIIEHTQKGVERLYRAAHTTDPQWSSTVPTGSRRGYADGTNTRASQARLQRPKDAYRPARAHRDDRPYEPAGQQRRLDRPTRHGERSAGAEDDSEVYDDGSDPHDTATFSSSGSSGASGFSEETSERSTRLPRSGWRRSRRDRVGTSRLEPVETARVAVSRSVDGSALSAVSSGRHTPLPTCRLVARRRARTAAPMRTVSGEEDTANGRARVLRAHASPSTSLTSAHSGARQHSVRTLPPSQVLQQPMMGEYSLLLSPDRSVERSRGVAHDRPDAGALTELAGPSMQTRFGQKWSETFHALFGAAAHDDSMNDHSTTAPAVSPSVPSAAPPATAQAAAVPVAPAAAVPRVQEALPAADASLESAAPVLDPRHGLSSVVVLRVREELRAKEQEIAQLRLTHAAELARSREQVSEARREAAQETADQLTAVFDVKQSILQSSLQSEQQRLADAREELSALGVKLRTTTEELSSVQADRDRYARSASELPTLTAERERLQVALANEQESARRAVQQVEALTRQLSTREQEQETTSQRVAALETQLLQQEDAARAALAKLEEEFTVTSGSYQQLLTEATLKMEKLEKVQRRYKSFKEEHTAAEEAARVAAADYAEKTASWAATQDRLKEELRATKEELQVAKEELETAVVAMRALQDAHDGALAELQRQSESHKVSASEQVRLLQGQVDTAQHTIELLRTRVSSLTESVTEEQTRNQELAMRMSEKELHMQEARQEQQRGAASYKVQTEETLSALRRQLKEKDTQLKALAASQAEPVRRLRAQLDEERGRRARLEEVFNAYKKRAKKAEESALAEIRREKLKNAAFLSSRSVSTTTAATPPFSQRSSTAETALTAARSAVADAVARRREIRSPAVGSTDGAADTPVGAEGAGRAAPLQDHWTRLSVEPETDGYSPPAVHTTNIAAAETALGRLSSVLPQPPWVCSGATASSAKSAASDDEGTAGVWQPLKEEEEPAVAPVTPLSATAGGLDSLVSGISMRTPYRSADASAEVPVRRNESAASPAPHAAEPGAMALQQPQLVTHAQSGGGSVAAAPATAATSAPHDEKLWYRRSVTKSPPGAEETPLDGEDYADDLAAVPRPARAWGGRGLLPPWQHRHVSPSDAELGAQLKGETDESVAQQQRQDAIADDHERRMRIYQERAAQAVQLMAASRGPFMETCTATVRESAARRRQLMNMSSDDEEPDRGDAS